MEARSAPEGRAEVNEGALAVTEGSRGRPWDDMSRIYKGGEPGRRRALFLVYVVFAPMSVLSSYAVVSGPDWWRSAVVKLVVIGTGVYWLWRRSSPRRWEWMLAAGAVPALSVLVTGLTGHGPAVLTPVIGAPMVLGLLALVLDGPVLAVALGLELIAGTIVLFHHLSTEQALLLTIALVTGVSVEVAVIYGTAYSLRRSLAELDAAAGERNRLHAEMALASDRERARIAGELHDDTIQVMTAAAVGLDALVRGADEQTAQRAAVIGVHVRDAVDRARSLSFDLYPAGLGDGGLAGALAELGRRTSEGAPFQVTVDVDEARASPDAEQLAYRTIKELVGNAAKHAQAAAIRIRAASQNGYLACEVRDDGCGFDPDAVVARRDDYHFGLPAAAERIRLYGGSFTVDATPGSGTRVAFMIPTQPTS